MRLRAAVALLALAVPVFAQRGGGRGASFGSRGGSFGSRAGSFGSGGFAGHMGFTGGPGFARPGNFVRSSQPFRFGATGNPEFQRRGPFFSSVPRVSYGPRISYGANRFASSRPLYRSQLSGASSAWNRDGGRGYGHQQEHDRFRDRRWAFNNWYLSSYLPWLGYGYPYVIDPGFYDWGDFDDSDDSAAEQDNDEQGSAVPNYPYPYPDEDYGAPGAFPPQGYAGGMPPYEPSAPAAAVPAPVPGEPLTVIFKDGRAPAKIQNYMMTAKVLTDLDPHRYQQVPLDQINVPATRQANFANGIDFQVPGS